MVWEGSDTLGESASLFTGAFAQHYHAPDGFCYDITCDDDPIEDDPRLAYYNLDQVVSGVWGMMHNACSRTSMIGW